MMMKMMMMMIGTDQVDASVCFVQSFEQFSENYSRVRSAKTNITNTNQIVVPAPNSRSRPILFLHCLCACASAWECPLTVARHLSLLSHNTVVCDNSDRQGQSLSYACLYVQTTTIVATLTNRSLATFLESKPSS